LGGARRPPRLPPARDGRGEEAAGAARRPLRARARDAPSARTGLAGATWELGLVERGLVGDEADAVDPELVLRVARVPRRRLVGDRDERHRDLLRASVPEPLQGVRDLDALHHRLERVRKPVVERVVAALLRVAVALLAVAAA